MKLVHGFGSKAHRMKSRGLTLMELVIVMAILAAVASILIPLIPNLLRRAHKSVDATQSSEIAKAIQTYQAAYFSYPDNYDLLTDGTAFPSYLPADDGHTFGNYVTIGTLTGDEAAALRRVGIKFVQKMASDAEVSTAPGFHPSRHPYPDATPSTAGTVDLSTGISVALLNAADLRNSASPTHLDNHLLEAELASDPTARYVVFGIGPRCSMVGKIIQDAPMSAPQNKEMTPDVVYAHFGVIFKVSGLEVERTERARLVAAVALEDDELESTDKDITGFYEVSKDPSVK